MSDFEVLVQVATMVIHLISLVVLMVVWRFVYKATGFGNKFIIAMILLLIMAIIMDSVFQIGYFITQDVTLNEEIWQFGVSCMSMALMINLRIWFVYLLKIMFMGQCLQNLDQPIDKLQTNLILKIRVVNAITCFVVFSKLMYEIYNYGRDVFGDRVREIELITIAVSHAIVGSFISSKLRTNFSHYYQFFNIRLAIATLLHVFVNVPSI